MIELFGTRVSGAAQTYVDDVFSTYLYTGNGSTQTITNGIDLSGQGGLVLIKQRSSTESHFLFDTARTATYELNSNTTDASAALANSLTAFNSDGFSVGSVASAVNTNTSTYASWTFRKAGKFFDVATATVSGGVDATVSFTNLTTLGMVIVKRTDLAGSWYVWHRSLTAGKLLYLEQTAAEATLGEVTVSGTTVTLEGGVIANGDYIVYGFAHDTSADGIIQAGSYIGTGADNNAVTLGWEPQFLMIKRASGGTGSWIMADTMRGIATPTAYDTPATVNHLVAESSAAETSSFTFGVTATGFNIRESNTQLNNSTDTYIYLAIRRQNKPPTLGTQVYNAIARTGTGAAATVTGVGFAPDFVYPMCRNDIANKGGWVDKLRGASANLTTNLTNAESTNTQGVTAFSNDGISIGTSSFFNGLFNYVNYFFRRAPGVFDVVCYTGTGSNKIESHNLTVAPELWIVKGRSGATAWAAGCTALANTEYLVPNTTAAKATGTTYWNSTFPTSSAISLGTAGDVNTNTATYVAYLFATKAGISKVGSYTGNGTNQTINCGFSGGARFILIKRTDSTGDWYVWDSTRGIVAGNDPHLSLNTTAAEVTTDDSIDPDSTGFIVNQDAATNINVNTATYIYLAFA